MAPHMTQMYILHKWTYSTQDEWVQFAFARNETPDLESVDNFAAAFQYSWTGRIFDGRFFSAKISSNLAGHGQITFALGNGRDLSPIWIVVNNGNSNRLYLLYIELRVVQKKHMFNWER